MTHLSCRQNPANGVTCGTDWARDDHAVAIIEVGGDVSAVAAVHEFGVDTAQRLDVGGRLVECSERGREVREDLALTWARCSSVSLKTLIVIGGG
jgi:hypothetical protein